MTAAAIITVRRIAATLVLALLCQIGAAAGMHHVPAEISDTQAPHAHQHASDGHYATNSGHCGDGTMNSDGGDACGDSAHACPLCAGACGHVIPGGSASCDAPHAGWPRLDRERAGPPAFTASLYRPPNRC